MSPLIQTHSNSMTGTGSGLGRPTSNSKLINPSAALQLSQTLAAMHSLRSMQQARTSLLAGKYYHHLSMQMNTNYKFHIDWEKFCMNILTLWLFAEMKFLS